MTTHTEVARRLAANSNSDEHSRPLRGTNMSFQPRTGSKPAAILGYGWAYYALRIDDTVILDTAWDGYSTSTTQHLTHIRGAVRSSEHVNLVEVEIPRSVDTYRRTSSITTRTRPSTDELLRTLDGLHGWDRSELDRLGDPQYRPDSLDVPTTTNGL